jgi:hypothetical protein
VTTGVKYDLNALTADASTLLHVPVFLAALLVVRGLPALLYRSVIPRDRLPVAVLMQATSLPFIVAATAVGLRSTSSRRPTPRPSSPRDCCRSSSSPPSRWGCCAAARRPARHARWATTCRSPPPVRDRDHPEGLRRSRAPGRAAP